MAYNEDALRVVGQEVQNPPPLLQVVLGVGAQAPDQVRELDAVTNEEHLQIEAPFAFAFNVTRPGTVACMQPDNINVNVAATNCMVRTGYAACHVHNAMLLALRLHNQGS